MISLHLPFSPSMLDTRLAVRRRLLRRLIACPLTLAVPAGVQALEPDARRPAERVHPRPLVFPADHGAHPSTRIEWWYVTGQVQATSPAHASDARPDVGDTCGFQVTFFRSRTDVASDHPSRFAARQLLFAHAALTDLRRGRQRHDQRVARAGFGIAEAAVGDTALTLRDWHFTRSAPLAPGRTDDGSRYRAQVNSNSAGFGFDFRFDTTQPLLLQGNAGYSRKGPQPGQASHYYSQPQLAVSGTLTRDGIALPVRGTAWLDHEWSDSLLDANAVGWDWIGMNLDDGSALTAFRLRDADGGTVHAGGSFRPAGGAVRDFATDSVRFVSGRLWSSPGTRARYPVEWTIDTPVGRFRVLALLDAQELDSRASTGSVYWEGLSELQDAQGRRVGRGYLEMTGYAGRLSL